ncbi:MAG: cytochrome c3 family protein [Lacunisphaera sp.]
MTGDPSAHDRERADEATRATRPLFSARASTVFRFSLTVALLLVVGSSIFASVYFHSASRQGIGFAPAQPVRFSHQLHARELRIDCRNCHAAVETSAFAGMPSTETCQACHSQLLTNAPALKPVMESSARKVPLQWTRVTRLPDYVFFDHSVHVNKGVSCINCHGEVGRMDLIAQKAPLTMRWCLDCHRNPAPNLRPASSVFAATLSATRSGPTPAELFLSDHIHPEVLTNCSTCHH